MDNPALFADFRLAMAEFQANGRDSPLDEPPAASPVISQLPQLCRQPPPSPPVWERRDILWSRHWRRHPDPPTNRNTSVTYNSGATYTGGSIISATDVAADGMYGLVYRTEGPFGSMLVVDTHPTSGGGARPATGDDSPLQRPPRAGRTAARKRTKQPNYCVFCKNNNELPCVYRSHILKDSRGRISCPILRVYTCPTCGANGDGAHTVKYCPQRQGNEGQRLESPLPPPPPRPAGRAITKRGCR